LQPELFLKVIIEGVEKDNKNELLVKPEWLEARALEKREVLIEGVDILEKIRKSEAKDDKVIKAVEEMKRAEVKVLRDEKWREEDGIILKKGKVYKPKDEKLRIEIIRLHHDIPIGEHRG